MLKEESGRLLLIAVNLDDTPLDIEFRFGRRVGQMRVLFDEDRRPVMTETGWRDTFGGFASRVYELRLAGPTHATKGPER